MKLAATLLQSVRSFSMGGILAEAVASSSCFGFIFVFNPYQTARRLLDCIKFLRTRKVGTCKIETCESHFCPDRHPFEWL